MKKFQNKPLSLVIAIGLIIITLIAFQAASNRVTLGLYTLIKIPTKIISAIFKTGYELLHFKSIAGENLRLKREVTDLKSKLATLNEALAENKRLKEILAIKDKLPSRLIVCRVIGRHSSNWTEGLIIDKGSNDGLRTDTAVFANGALIGKITAVGISSARVSLITDPEIRIAAISQRTRASGLIYGIARGRSIMKFIPKDADVKANDLVVSSGLSGIYPKGFLIGTVLDVKMEPNGLYQFALIEPAANPMAIEEVMVIE